MLSSEGRKDNPGFAGIWVPAAARVLIRGVTATMRIHRDGFDLLDLMEREGRKAVFTFFHGRQFLLTGCLAGHKMGIMASMSRDGELQARVMAGFGFGVVRGSASRGGARGFLGLMKLMEEGYFPAFAVDGPRGPIHEVKPGAVYLAKRTGVPVIPMASSARPAHIFKKAWDRYMLPLPFSRGAAIMGEPITFNEDLKEEAMKRDCAFLQVELLRLQEKADRITGLRF